VVAEEGMSPVLIGVGAMMSIVASVVGAGFGSGSGSDCI